MVLFSGFSYLIKFFAKHLADSVITWITVTDLRSCPFSNEIIQRRFAEFISRDFISAKASRKRATANTDSDDNKDARNRIQSRFREMISTVYHYSRLPCSRRRRARKINIQNSSTGKQCSLINARARN